MSNFAKSKNTLPIFKSSTVQRGVLAALLMSGGFAQAVTVYSEGEKSLNIGMGLLTTLKSGTQSRLNLDDVRVYTSGKISKDYGFTFNMARDTGAGADQMRVMDAIGQIEVTPQLNVWVGQFLPPSDRQNLNGPYYSTASPTAYGLGLQAAYPAKFKGRDVGAAVWGDVDKFKYQLGVFSGSPKTTASAPNIKGDTLYAARVSYAFLDAEPGYYTSGTYFGAKNIATVGLSWQGQKNAYGTTARPSDFKGMGVDFLFEKKLEASSAITLEGGYSKFDLGDNLVTATTHGTAYYLVPFQGKSWFIQPAYYTGYKVGTGVLQPYLKYTKSTPDTGFGTESHQTDVGLGYLIKGYDTRVFANYSKPSQASSVTSLTLQLQF